MCEPTIALAAIAATSSAVSIYGNKEATEFQAEQTAQNVRNANAAAMQAYELDTQQLGLAEVQEQDAAADERMNLLLDTQRSVATARAAGAESGLAGYSLDAQIDDFVRQGFNNVTTLDANVAASEANRIVERKGIYNAAKNRQQSFNPYQPSSGVFYSGAALQIANSAVQGYSQGKSLEN